MYKEYDLRWSISFVHARLAELVLWLVLRYRQGKVVLPSRKMKKSHTAEDYKACR